jgi:hypothetical protein
MSGTVRAVRSGDSKPCRAGEQRAGGHDVLGLTGRVAWPHTASPFQLNAMPSLFGQKREERRTDTGQLV